MNNLFRKLFPFSDENDTNFFSNILKKIEKKFAPFPERTKKNLKAIIRQNFVEKSLIVELTESTNFSIFYLLVFLPYLSTGKKWLFRNYVWWIIFINTLLFFNNKNWGFSAKV